MKQPIISTFKTQFVQLMTKIDHFEKMNLNEIVRRNIPKTIDLDWPNAFGIIFGTKQTRSEWISESVDFSFQQFVNTTFLVNVGVFTMN